MKTVFAITIALLILTACSKSEQPVATPMPAQPMLTGGTAHAIPGTTIFKMNGEWADHVTVTVNATGTGLVSYPDPRDVSTASAPLPLVDGWWLDRRGGMGPNTRFTRYTWAEYSVLPQVPAQAELLKAIIPDARVTATRTLNIPIGTATPEQCIRLLKAQ